MSHRSFSEVQSDSRKAVEKAGLRERRGATQTAGTWREQRGKLPEGEVFRPGKTASRRRGRTAA